MRTEQEANSIVRHLARRLRLNCKTKHGGQLVIVGGVSVHLALEGWDSVKIAEEKYNRENAALYGFYREVCGRREIILLPRAWRDSPRNTLIETIVHELAHAIIACYPQGDPHGSVFRLALHDLLRRAGLADYREREQMIQKHCE